MSNYKNNVFKPYYEQLNAYLRKTSKEIPCKSIVKRKQDFLLQLAKRECDEHLTGTKAYATIIAMEIDGFVNDLNKTMKHVFIENESLVDFFKKVEFKDFNLLKSFIEETDIKAHFYNSNTDVYVDDKFISTVDNIRTSHHMLHTFNNCYLISTLRSEESSSFSVVSIFDGLNQTYTCVPLIDKKAVINFVKDNTLAKIGLNFLAYCKAFPECLVNGVPNLSKSEKEQYSTPKLLKTESSIIERVGNSVSPHFRAGHFRLLQDDRYVNKKGQVVFVKATMVNGKAKTLKKNNENMQVNI